MKERAKFIVLKGQVAHRHEANALLREPGSAVLVLRGIARSIAIACPDGCGDQLTINLDDRAGPAWRYYVSSGEISIFPSIWRDTGCLSHFIVWESKIYWCDLYDELDAPHEDLLELTLHSLDDELRSYVEIAERLDLVPWTALSACRRLRDLGMAESGTGWKQTCFRSAQVSEPSDKPTE